MKRDGEAAVATSQGAPKKPKIDAAALRAKLQKTLSTVKKLQKDPPAQPSQPAVTVAGHATTASIAAASALQPPSTAATVKEEAEPGPQTFDRSLKLRRRKPGLELFQIGALPKEHRAALDAKAAEAAAAAEAHASEALDSAAALAGPLQPPDMEPVPDIEWWDAAVLARGDYEAGDSGVVEAKPNKITNLVEHPVPLEPPVEAPAVAPRALMLTKKEKKKLRKQRREEREKEKQQNIQLGLMEPPKDKVRLSNMARVYGAAGVVDATAIELKVRAAQAERQRAHEDRNAARKLTTAERKEKKMKKLFDNEAADVIVQVFRVTRLDDKKNQYKVVINAQENRLAGVCVVTEEGINVVVVEGEKKGIRRFHRLMTHRINWNPTVDVEEADDEMFEELNKCFLVWQGTAAEGAFEDFRRQDVGGNIEGRAILAAAGVAHYWDAAQSFVPDGVTA